MSDINPLELEWEMIGPVWRQIVAVTLVLVVCGFLTWFALEVNHNRKEKNRCTARSQW